MKKNNLIMIVVTISMFVVLLLGATYAYFASNTNVGNGLDMTITTDNNNIAFAATEGTLSMHVKAEDMLQSQTGSGDVLAAETVGEDNIVITLSTNTETPIACTYNVYFQWNEGQQYKMTSGLGLEQYKELTLQLNLEDEDGNGDTGINSFATEIQITRVVTGTAKTKIVNGAYIVGSSSNSGNQEWVPTVRFYNLRGDQSALAGKTFGGKFTIEDVECNAIDNNLSDTLVVKAESSVTSSGVNEYISSQDNTPYVIKHETVEHEGMTYDAGIRYEGKDPDNYVVFNGEEWRIIGLFEGSTIGLEPDKQYTKIIRSQYAYWTGLWDCKDKNGDGDCRDSGEYENDWTNSTLNAYLNGEYMNGNGKYINTAMYDVINIRYLTIDAKNMIAQYNGNYSTWYLRGATSSQDATATTDDWYMLERVTGGATYRNGVLGDADTSISSAIALVSPSDYGYAAYGEECAEGTPLSSYGAVDWNTMRISGCSNVDWLYSYTGWWLTPYLDDASKVYGLTTTEGVLSYNQIYYDGSFYPVLYLDNSVKMVGGNGSKANPYKLS